MEKQTENEKINTAGKYLKSIASCIIGISVISIIAIFYYESVDLKLCQLLNIMLGIRIIFCLYKAGNNLISYKEKEEK